MRGVLGPPPPLEIWKQFSIDLTTGIARYRIDTKRHKAGDIAGCRSGRDGHLMVWFRGVGYKVHRLVWLYATGDWPDLNIDHIDRTLTNGLLNNRLSNLRPATKSENGANTKIRCDNVSGVPGVCWDKTKNKWRVQTGSSRKGGKSWVGCFERITDACRALYRAACTRYGEFVSIDLVEAINRVLLAHNEPLILHTTVSATPATVKEPAYA